MSQVPGTSGSAGTSGTAKSTGSKSKSDAAKSAGSKSSHPPYAAMIQQSLTAIKGKSASRQALLKYMMKNFDLGQDEKAVNSHLKLALKTGLDKGLLVQTTGKGATGSVKLNKNAVTAGPAKAATAKKPKAATAAKKPTVAKAATAKKTVKPKKVSLGTAKAKKPSLTKKSTSKVVAKPKMAPKKAVAAKPKAKAAKPKISKAPAAGKGKKPAGRK